MPTKEQLDSRQQLKEFVDKVGGTLKKISTKAKSDWFGRPDNELKGWIDRGRAINEIQGSLGYRLIIHQTNQEILWAQQQLEVCDEKQLQELRLYLRSLRFLHDFIITTERNADIATGVLAGRDSAIGKETTVFIKNNATVRP